MFLDAAVGATPLWQALGCPPRHDPLPPRTSHAWAQANRGLLPLAEIGLPRIRAPTALWRLLHQSHPPRNTTWDQLCRNFTLHDLVHPLRRARGISHPPLFSWNIRHLRSTRTPNNHEKRNILFRSTVRGRAGLIQETHWTAHDAVVWASLLQGRQVFAAPGILTPGHGISGGVAIVLAAEYTDATSTVLVPGYALMVVARYKEQPVRLVSCYLPPNARETTMAALFASLPPPDDIPTYYGGDVNFQTLAPRDGEGELVSTWLDTHAARGGGAVLMDGPTYISRQTESQIDAAVVPVTVAALYEVTKTWRLPLSDHAMLFLNPRTDITTGRSDALTPWAFKALPTEAHQDLRRRYLSLEVRFGIPRVDLTELPQPTNWIRPMTPGDPPLDDHGGHPDEETDDDSAPAPAVPAAAPADHDAAGLDAPPPLLPNLLAHGRGLLTGMLQSWWQYWRRRKKQTSPLVVLRHAMTGQAHISPTGALLSWMRSLGWEGSTISPAEAGVWHTRWKADQDQRAAERLTTWQRGPGAARAPLDAQYQIAREVYTKAQALRGVRDHQGQWHERPANMERVLWESRADIWGTCPSLPPEADRLHAHYRQGRPQMQLPQRPRPSWKRIATLVLTPAGSAPGVDGEPYEAYHCGVRFVTCLLAQAMYAAEYSDELLLLVLGDSVDLLVWIPKSPNAETPNDLRPLQLPTCFRRLFGAIIADLVGGPVEEHLSPDQAAIAGGQCGPNISAVCQHLAQAAPSDPPPGPAWRAVLGDDAEVLDDYIEEVASSLPSCPSASVAFADQNKAFERVAMQWAAILMAGWGFPLWIIRSLLGLCQKRGVRFQRGKYRGPIRLLRRSVGMGGTASPLLWCLSYDPVIAATAQVANARCPTYVDDLAALLSGARQALRVAFFLPWVSRAIGLHIATHHCRRLVLLEPPPEVEPALATLPVDWTRASDGTITITGLTPPVVDRLLRRRLGERVGPTQVVHSECRCSLKTAIVPSRYAPWWRRLMDFSPFGASSVQDKWPYLGACCVVCARETADQTGLTMSTECLNMLRQGTWGKAMTKLRTRAASAVQTHASPGRRAAIWNTYMISLIPYPAQIIAPDRPLEDALKAQFRVALGLAGTHWVPHYVLCGLGLLFQVPSCPRCPVASARAVAALAAYRGQVWGPPRARTLADLKFRACITWAQGPLGEVPPRRLGSKVLTLQRVHARLQGHPAAPLPLTGPQSGRLLYGATWGRMYHDKTMTWFRTRSAARPWAPGHGREWHLLRFARNYTAAHHVTRFLTGGLAGGSRWRPHTLRAPRECVHCHGRARHTWDTDTDTLPGLTWCSTCMGDWGPSPRRWAMIPQDILPEALHEEAAVARARHGPLPRGFVPRPSQHGTCPLCGLGEAGAEHLGTWCPAVALAWRLVRSPDSDMAFGEALLHEPSHNDLLCHFTHQVVYRHNVGLALPPLAPEDGAQAILAGLVVPKDDVLEGVEEDHQLYRAAEVEGVWERVGDPCPLCTPVLPPPRATHGSSLPAQTASRARGGGALRRSMVVGSDTPAGTSILALRSDQRHGGWLLAGPGWVPMPRCDRESHNATWIETYCSHCFSHRATLQTIRPALARQEVIVDRSPFPNTDTHAWPLEVTFDGGARALQGDNKVGGAGATLWHHPPDGEAPVLVASCVVALPGVNNAQIAEACGCRAALALLAATTGLGHSARVVGDNLAVVRYGAGTGRFKRLVLQAQLEQALGPLAARGWSLTWQAVRRRLNKAADRLATIGVFWAEALRRAGHDGMTQHTVWHQLPPPPVPSYFPLPGQAALRPADVEEGAQHLEELARTHGR